MAMPARQNQIKQANPLSIVTPHAAHPFPSSPHLCQDGSQAARDAGTPAPAHPSLAHPRAFQGLCTSQQGCPWHCLHVKIKSNKQINTLSIVTPHATHLFPHALTYLRMVRRQHATPELQHLLIHCNRIRVPSKVSVRRSKVAHGRACTSKSNQTNQTPLNRHTACSASLLEQPSPM
jgi:hypothetical protein